MKKIIPTLTVLITVLIVFQSCKKKGFSNDFENVEILNDNSYIDKLPLNKKIEYANENLKILGVVFNKLWKNHEFRELIVEKLDKKTSDNSEAQILFSDLMDEVTKNKKLKLSRKDLIDLDTGIKAFSGIIKGEDIKPQIFIPFYNESKRTKLLNKNVSEPVYVFNTDPNEPNELVGYNIDSNDNFIETGNIIDEEKAQQMDNLFVLGINEFDPDDVLINNSVIINDTITPDMNQNNTSSQSLHFLGDLFLTRMKITKHLESWASGKSEVHFKAIAISGDHNGYEVNLGNNLDFVSNENKQILLKNIPGYTSSPKGQVFGVWKRREVRNKVIKQNPKRLINNFIDFNIYSGQNLTLLPSNTHCSQTYLGVNVIVFEYDPWPAPKKHAGVLMPISSIIYGPPYNNYILDDDAFVYRSNNGLYGAYMVFNIPFTKLNEVNPGFYNINDTDEVIDTAPYDRSPGLPYIKHHTQLH